MVKYRPSTAKRLHLARAQVMQAVALLLFKNKHAQDVATDKYFLHTRSLKMQRSTYVPAKVV